MCYLYARSRDKVLYLKDTKNNITDSFHLILDTFKELPGITYTLQNAVTIQQVIPSELKNFYEIQDIDFLRSEAKRIFQLQPSIQKKIALLRKGLPGFDLGVHIRTGDKITSGEMQKIPLEAYLKQITEFQPEYLPYDGFCDSCCEFQEEGVAELDGHGVTAADYKYGWPCPETI